MKLPHFAPMQMPRSQETTRDPRVEDPSNLWIIHPSARALVPLALRLGISANMVSVVGLVLGMLAAFCYWHWDDWRFATAGFILCISCLIADGLDGMVARATGTASPFGRFLDGLCDHGVFGIIYFTFAFSIGTLEGWILGWLAAGTHAVQSSLYEGERLRYHRRLRGELPPSQTVPANPLVRAYDKVAYFMDRAAAPFDAWLCAGPGRTAIYGQRATAPMKMLALLSANMRVLAIYVAAMLGNPLFFWWFEIIILSAVAFFGILWHRRLERVLMDKGISRAEG